MKNMGCTMFYEIENAVIKNFNKNELFAKLHLTDRLVA